MSRLVFTPGVSVRTELGPRNSARGMSAPWSQFAGSDWEDDGTASQLTGSKEPLCGPDSALERMADELLANAPNAVSERLCVVCDETFEARADAKTCSPACRKRLSRILAKELPELASLDSEVIAKRYDTDENFRGLADTIIAARGNTSEAGLINNHATPMNPDHFEALDADGSDDDATVITGVLWGDFAKSPEEIVTGETPAWKLAGHHLNPHRLRWPTRLTDS
jgi:hypothetical protein